MNTLTPIDPVSLPIALLYDDGAYREMTTVTPANETRGGPQGLMGRQVAGLEFLQAFLQHGRSQSTVALVRGQASEASFRRVWTEQTAKRPDRTCTLVPENRFLERFLTAPESKGPPASILHLPQPPEARLAWARRHRAGHAVALSGVTHTLSSLGAVSMLTDLVTAPFEPYDTLICTSQAVVSMVRAVTDAYAEHLHDRFGGGGTSPALTLRMETIPLGVDTNKFRPATPEQRQEARKLLGIDPDELVVLFVGRISFHAKAHPFPMFDGLARAAKTTDKPVRLILSGWVSNQAIAKAFQGGAQVFAANIQVQVVDGMKAETRYAVWDAADIVASPSDNIQETFGLVPVEAMACGLPIVASDWDGYRETVVDGQTGLLVPSRSVVGALPDTTVRLLLGEINYDHYLATCNQTVAVDSTATAKAFEALLGDPDLRARLGQAGRQRAVEHYDWTRIIERYEQLWVEQEAERRRIAQADTAPSKMKATIGPACYPVPDVAYASYPTAQLDGPDRLRAAPHAAERIVWLLQLPLTSYVSEGRSNNDDQIRALLRRAEPACTLDDLDDACRDAGLKPAQGRATVAWMLKYGLLEVDRSDA